MTSTAMLAFQFTVLIAVGIILAINMILAFLDNHRVRHTENFLTGAAYGFTAAVIIATLYSVALH